ncbi:hypothetical protein N7454_003906 [Penicillium verhagenii]|nr:hypothetical protein N7454_003906 [Penicillium verhagenii]
MAYYPPEFLAWNNSLSTVSDPQSPRSNGDSILGMSYVASPTMRSEDLTIPTLNEYPAPDGLLDIDHTQILLTERRFDGPLDHCSPFDQDFDLWSGSQSDRNATPEQQWSPPRPIDMALSQSEQHIRRSKGRPSSSNSTSTSKGVRKSTERRPTSVSSRSRRRRGTSNADSGATRTFVCSFASYGCESTFVSKNEWKRHVTSQHLQLGFYRCDVGKCAQHQHTPSSPLFSTPPSISAQSFMPASKYTSRSKSISNERGSTPPLQNSTNDFNRKDLFTQHHRRMHAPWLQAGHRRAPTEAEHGEFEASLEEVRQRCWHGLRTPPLQSHCGFCGEMFTGEGSWDVRMEHIGRHFERDDQSLLGDEGEDLALREWGLQQGILVVVDGGVRLASLVGLGLQL